MVVTILQSLRKSDRQDTAVVLSVGVLNLYVGITICFCRTNGSKETSRDLSIDTVNYKARLTPCWYMYIQYAMDRLIHSIEDSSI